MLGAVLLFLFGATYVDHLEQLGEIPLNLVVVFVAIVVVENIALTPVPLFGREVVEGSQLLEVILESFSEGNPAAGYSSFVLRKGSSKLHAHLP